jgi:hypothetical protein
MVETLVHLAEPPGETVSKEQLIPDRRLLWRVIFG